MSVSVVPMECSVKICQAIAANLVYNIHLIAALDIVRIAIVLKHSFCMEHNVPMSMGTMLHCLKTECISLYWRHGEYRMRINTVGM